MQVGNARFSPDGTQIVFHARDGENKNIYIAPVEGAAPRPLITDAADDSFPAWSADGKFVYFASDRTGINQIWRVPSGGGDAVQITRGGGLEAIASPDGKYIYYVKDSPDKDSPGGGGLWRVSTAAAAAERSDEMQITELAREGFQNIWALTPKGIFFIARSEKSPVVIKFYDFFNNRVSAFGQIENFAASKNAGMTISPDTKDILFAQFDQNASNIMVAEIDK